MLQYKNPKSQLIIPGDVLQAGVNSEYVPAVLHRCDPYFFMTTWTAQVHFPGYFDFINNYMLLLLDLQVFSCISLFTVCAEQLCFKLIKSRCCVLLLELVSSKINCTTAVFMNLTADSINGASHNFVSLHLDNHADIHINFYKHKILHEIPHVLLQMQVTEGPQTFHIGVWCWSH